ncbi:MAG: hypothetical protein CFE44_21915 [Burkholderiales bacterium PBB4]|nr:MAG: hypothetical protein CFE44_21915 [Burkholderiales bacterium PBB4]
MLHDLCSGLAIAALLEGFNLAVKFWLPKDEPALASAKLWESFWPLADTAVQSVWKLCIVIGVIAVLLASVQLAKSARFKFGMLLLVAVCAVCEVLSADQAAQGLAKVLALAIPMGAVWALVARDEVGIAIAALAWATVIDLPAAVAVPLTDAGWHALIAALTTAVVTAWALRYGRSLGAGHDWA